MSGKKTKAPAPRYGIAELYGHSLSDISAAERVSLLRKQKKPRPCDFRGDACNKKGGVCSLRLYRADGDASKPADASIVTLCPQRFRDGNSIFKWVGSTLLGCERPTIVREVPFLTSTVHGEDVGQIDMVLVEPGTSPLHWCALEIQSVYFSGPGMTSQFKALRAWKGDGLPFPDKVRRPDFRSSGPKRLMPQLQTKVPTLRRWGKKTAVVVDLPFWESLAEMDCVRDVSNCDVAWFVVKYEKEGGRFRLVPHKAYFTTLEDSVEGLTGGQPISLADFEASLAARRPRG